MTMGLDADGISSAEGRVLSVQLSGVREDMKEIKESVAGLQRSLESLVRLQEQQRDLRTGLGRAFDEIRIEREKREDLAGAVARIVAELPGYRSLRRWVIGGVSAGVGMMAIALFNLLVIQPLYRGYGATAPSTTIITPAQPEHLK